MPLDAQTLSKRRVGLKQRRANYDSLLEEIAQYVRPDQMGFTSDQPPTEGSKRTSPIYDETAIEANEDFALSLEGGVCNRALEWLRLALTDEALNRDPEVQEFLEDTTRQILRTFEQSNFYAAIHEAFQDAGAFGMFSVLLDEAEPGPGVPTQGFRGLVAETWPLRSIWIAEGPGGVVDTVFRDFEMTADTIRRRWPKTCPANLVDLARTSPDERIPLVLAVYPRPEGDAFPFPVVHQVLYEGGEKTILDERGHEEMPVIVTRLRKRTGELYGAGRAHIALPAIRSINELARLDLAAVGKIVNPPVQAPDRGVNGTVRLIPKGVTYVRPGSEIKEIQPSLAKFQITEAKYARFEAKINRIFFRDLTRLPSAGPEMTAREVLIRYELMQRRFAPVIGPILSDFFDRAIRRVFGLLYRAGALRPLPRALEGRAWVVKYESPLARAQQLATVDAIESYATLDVPAMEAVQPGAKDVLDADEALRIIASIKGVPAKIVRDRRKVAELRAARAEVERRELQKQDAVLAARAARDVAAARREEAQVGSGTPGPEGLRAVA